MKADLANQGSESTHPPLAYDAQGFKLGVPDGTTHWRILRHTRGRPKPVPGQDMQPARFELELTPDELLEICGPGTYRIEALDQYGGRLGCVTTVTLGADGPAATSPDPSPGSLVRSPQTNDLRIAMETIAQISRSHTESLRALATAQADWIKTLATAKAIPRNGFAPAPMPLQIVDDDREAKPGWLKALEPAMPLLVTSLLRNVGTFFGAPQKELPAAPRRNATPSNHVALVRARLTPNEQQLMDSVLADEEVGAGLRTMLQERDVDEAVALVREKIKAKSKKRRAEHAATVLAALEPEEREGGAKVLEMIQMSMGAQFVHMTVAQAVEIVRRSLAAAALHEVAS